MKNENFKQKIKNKVGRPKKKNFLSIIKENKKEDENFKENKKNKVNRNKKSFSFSKIDESLLKISKNTEIKVGRTKKTPSLPKINNNIINNLLKIRKVNEIKKQEKKNIEKKDTNLKHKL